MQDDSSNKSIISILIIVVLVIALVGSIVFGVWAFNGRKDYKNNSDKKVTAAVAVAKTAQAKELQAKFDQQAKVPYRTYSGPSTYGSVTFKYPKTWSAYVDSSASDVPINGYYHPGEVPGVQSNIAFALRVELSGRAYSEVVQGYNSQITQGALTARAYLPPKMKGVANTQVGTLLTGSFNQDKNGEMLIIQVRDKTLQVYTESRNYLSDLNNIILPSLQFTP